jgi:acetamidase/formamidase
VTDVTSPNHRLDRGDALVHQDWDRSRDPVLTVEDGDVVEFACRDATNGQMSVGATADDVRAIDFRGHPLTGPVAVDGAEPGDTLAVDVLGVDHEGVGWTHVYPGTEEKGLLPAEFPDAHAVGWELGEGVARYGGIELPLAPFPGNLGVAPAEPGPHSTSPPRAVGGNLDVKHLTAGSTLYLPVAVEGGLFSVGDLHGAQGDGEVCVTAIEMPGRVTLRLRLVEREVSGPELETDGSFEPAGGGRAIATSGVAGALEPAAKDAVRAMVDRLVADAGLSRADAYVVCSVAADLKVSEIVNGNVVVTAYASETLLG